MTEALLQAINLGKRYRNNQVLHAVAMQIMPREIVTIIGPNGAGKTTLLQCLLGLQTPDSGEVKRKPGLKIGYAPQNFRANQTMPLRVIDFLQLYAGRNNIDPAMLDLLAITALLQQQLTALSGGELRRVMLARAMLNQPDLLVLDEPTQGIDINGQNEFYGLLARLPQSHGCAVLMVSHDLHVVMASTHRVICLNQHICCEGAPKTIGNEPAFKQLFGEALASQLALYQHHHTHAHGLHGEILPLPHQHSEGCNHA
jgi:zinc transport system ATP-binding protein